MVDEHWFSDFLCCYYFFWDVQKESFIQFKFCHLKWVLGVNLSISSRTIQLYFFGNISKMTLKMKINCLKSSTCSNKSWFKSSKLQFPFEGKVISKNLLWNWESDFHSIKLYLKVSTEAKFTLCKGVINCNLY